MTKYLISFPSEAMQLAPDEFAAAGRDSRAVIRAMKAAGVYVFGGGIDEAIAPVLVDGDGSATTETYPRTSQLTGGFTVIEAPTWDDAVAWAARIAEACRCDQELRAFMFDPES